MAIFCQSSKTINIFGKIGRIWKYLFIKWHEKRCPMKTFPFEKFFGKIEFFLEFLLKGGECLPEVEFFP